MAVLSNADHELPAALKFVDLGRCEKAEAKIAHPLVVTLTEPAHSITIRLKRDPGWPKGDHIMLICDVSFDGGKSWPLNSSSWIGGGRGAIDKVTREPTGYSYHQIEMPDDESRQPQKFPVGTQIRCAAMCKIERQIEFDVIGVADVVGDKK